MRILAADDQADVRLLLELSLAMEPDIALTLVDSGVAALAEAASGQFDLIVLDGLMPDLDGAATCRRLKEDPRTAQIPVVFLTGLSSHEARADLRAAGAVGFVTKPFDPFELAAELRVFARGAS
jgi:CheY-like chemotaxis protein